MFQWKDYSPDAPENTLWDVVIVGAGMGGSVLGWSLARHNLGVLFLERGRPVSPFSGTSKQRRLRRWLWPKNTIAADLAALGRWNRPITASRDGRNVEFYAAMGNGPGGSSAIYGAALERLRREDFAAANHEELRPKPLPNGWPINYDDFIPYYLQAEALFGVRGTVDPTDPDDNSVLRPPPPLSEQDSHFFDCFEADGLKPYRLHVGIDYRPGCVECLNVLCPRDCKAEGASRALKPALMEHNAKLLVDFEVERLETTDDQIKHVIGRLHDQNIVIRATIVVLAAGALNTPVILLNSIAERWPYGIGNDNGLVGRGLMFHVSELFALWPKKKVSSVGPAKTLSTRAMNVVDGAKLGGIQSLGGKPTPPYIYGYIMGIFESNLRFKIPLMNVAAKVAAYVGSWIFRHAAIFATIMEDFAYHENRVISDRSAPSGFSIAYVGTKELFDRTSLMRKLIRRRLKQHRMIFLTTGDNLNYGHPSGTCRFGDSPETSVLTPDNKVRGVSNLYIADASFFPSCGGTNPGLTVAANALRVADIIRQNLGTPNDYGNQTN